MMILEVLWKSTAALGTALCVCALLQKASADVRKLILSIAVVAVFVSAVMWPLPRWTAVAPPWLTFQPTPVAAAPNQLRAPAWISDEPEFAALDMRPGLAHSSSGRIDFRRWLLPMLWFVGAAILLVRFAVNLRGLRRLRNASEPVTGQQLPVSLWRNESIPAPVTWGIFRPIVLVPAGFEDLQAATRDAVLCHELAHIQAHDFLMRGLAEIARALIWFQPLIWIVRRQLREEQELACDNRVLAAGGKPSAYAKLLLDWDARPGMDYLVAVGIANRSCLKRRLYALLDPDQRRDTVAGPAALSTWFAGLAMAAGLAALGFAQATPATTAQTTPAPRTVAVPKAPVQIAQVQMPAPRPAVAQALKFDSISIQPCHPGDGPGRSGRGDMGANGGVNPNVPEGVGGYFRASPGRLDITCGSVLTMIGFAYIENGTPLLNNRGTLLRAQKGIRGVPQWAMPARYTIHAVTSDPVANGPTDAGPAHPGRLPVAALLYGPMLQGLLEDRFQLKTHREVEQAPMYALTVAPGGFRLKPIQDGECTPHEPGSGMFYIPGADDKPYCRWVGWPINGPNRTLLGGGITMEALAESLGTVVLDRNVVDRTGIAGSFRIRLEYAPDENTPCFGPADACKVNPESNIPRAATIFGAMEEQLGLKLEPINGPMEHIAIDRVERPSEN